MKKQMNRLLSLLLSVMMVLGMMPAVTPHVHAAGTGETVLVGPDGSVISPTDPPSDSGFYNTNLQAFYLNSGGTYTLTTDGISASAVSLMVNTIEDITIVLDNVSIDVEQPKRDSNYYEMLNEWTQKYTPSAIEIVQADPDLTVNVELKIKGVNNLKATAETITNGYPPAVLRLTGVNTEISGYDSSMGNVLNISNGAVGTSIPPDGISASDNLTLSSGVTYNIGDYSGEGTNQFIDSYGISCSKKLIIDDDAVVNIGVDNLNAGYDCCMVGTKEIRAATVHLRTVKGDAIRGTTEIGDGAVVTAVSDNDSAVAMADELTIGDGATVSLTSHSENYGAVLLNSFGSFSVGENSMVTITSNASGNNKWAVKVDSLGSGANASVGSGSEVRISSAGGGLFSNNLILGEDAKLIVHAEKNYGINETKSITVGAGATLHVNSDGTYAICAPNSTGKIYLNSGNVLVHGKDKAFYIDSNNKDFFVRGITPSGEISTSHSTDTYGWDEKDSVNWTAFTEGYTDAPWFKTDAPAPDEHSCVFGDWVDDNNGRTHTRTCTVNGCTVQNNTETTEHTWGDWVITTQPTCVAEGVRTATCASCKATKTMAIPAVAENHNFGGWESISDTQHSRSCRNNGCTATETADHTLAGGVIQAETCETDGQEYYSCTTCGYEKFTTRPALNHSWGEWEVVTPATETTEGLERRVCANDNNHVQEQAIPVLTHTHTVQAVAAVDATCMEPGNIACYQCSGCQRYFSDAEGTTELNEEDVIIPALGHDWGAWTDMGVNAPADVHERSCDRDGCDATEIGNHQWGNWTCVDADTHKKTCAICSGERTAEHTFGEWTEQQDGSLKRVCTACDASETMDLSDDNVGEVADITDPTTNAASANLAATNVGLFNSVLDEEDYAAVANGATISVYLEVEDITDSVPAADVTAAAGAAAAQNDNTKIGMYLDIDLNKKVGDNAPVAVTQTNNDITITITVPDELINTDPNVTRTYKIVRVHDGWAEIIFGDFDPVTKTLTFKTSKFSTYALAYADTSTPVYDPYIPAPATYPVSTAPATNGAVKVNYTNVVAGATVTITVEPKTGYTLETLTVLDQLGRQIPVTNVGGGKYTFRMPAGGVTVVPTFMEDNTMLNFFVDVKAGDYYYDAVLWAAVNGITKGDTAVTFAPDKACTRGQMVTFLWRAAGCPEPTGTAKGFADVAPDSYYSKAVLWAVEQGITNGTGNGGTTFSPNDACTRAQMATFLMRLAGGKAVGGGAGFADVKADAYYAEAVQWAAENGITNGTGDNKFSPDATCTRGQMVTFLYRYFAN